MSRLLDAFAARSTDDRIAVRDDAGEHTYAAIVRGAIAVQRSLTAGAPSLRGERVGVFVGPSAEFISALFGVLSAGGCAVVLSPLHPAPETRYLCEDSGVKTVLVSRALREQASGFAEGLRLHEVSRPWDDDTGQGAPVACAETDAALQLYTSGTTGRPKGAVLTHENIGVQQALVGEAWGFSERDVLLHALPLHHMHGLAIALLTALGAGATIRMRSFDATAIWSEMADATVFMGVPAMYHRLFVAFDAADAETKKRWSESAAKLRLATSGSAALPVTLAERWKDLTGTIPLERFGMTEIGVGITNSLAGPRFAGCVGLPLPTVEARIVGEDGADAATGELWIRGPSVFVGYHRKESETASAFVERAGDDGGRWFRTGDTVTRDESLPGRPYRILGRTSVDILKSGGYKLSALEIEEVLRDHAAVAETAVIGVADEAWGDRVVACVVLRPDRTCDENELRELVRSRLAPYKVPKNVLFLTELPKNALGKVVKPELARQITPLVSR